MAESNWFKRILGLKKVSVVSIKSRLSNSHGKSSLNRASPEIDAPLDSEEFGHEVHPDDCKRLYRKILEQALIDYFTRGVPSDKNRQRQYNADLEDAWDFLFCEDDDWRRQREIICDNAGVNSDLFSERVIKWRREKLNLD